MNPELPALWTPSKFAGTDLLPIAKLPANEPQEELVGRENIEDKDLILPQIKLLQGISDEVMQGVPGAVPGKFVNTASGELFAAPLRVLLVFHFKSRALFPREKWRDNPRLAGLERCVARDGVTGTVYGDCGVCPHQEWGKGRFDAPPCSESHNFVVMTASGPASLRFSRTSLKSGRKFVSNFKMSGKNMWHHPALVQTRMEQKEIEGKKATYFVMDLLWAAGEAVPQPYREQARKLYDTVKAFFEAGRLAPTEPGDEEHTESGS